MKHYQKQIASLIGIFLLIYLGLYYFWARPRFFNLRQKYFGFKEGINQLNEVKGEKQSLESLQGEEERIDQAIKVTEQAIPKDSNISDFLIQFNSAVLQSGCVLKSIEIKKASSSSQKETSQDEEEIGKSNPPKTPTQNQKLPYKTIKFSAGIEGGVKQLQDFLGLVDSSSRLVDLTQINISPSQGGSLQISLEGVIYYQ